MGNYIKKSVSRSRAVRFMPVSSYNNALISPHYVLYALPLRRLSKTTLEVGKVCYSRSLKVLAIGLQTHFSRRYVSKKLAHLRVVMRERKNTNAQQYDSMDDEDYSDLPRPSNWDFQKYNGVDSNVLNNPSSVPAHHDYRAKLEDDDTIDCILPLYTSFPLALQYPEGYVCESDEDIIIHSVDHAEPVIDYLIESVDILSLPALSVTKPAHIKRVTAGVGLLSLDSPFLESSTATKGASSDFTAAFWDSFEIENTNSISMEIDFNQIAGDIDMPPATNDSPCVFERQQTPSPLQGQTPYPSGPTTPMECPPTPPFEPLYFPQRPLSLPPFFFAKLAQVESEADVSETVPMQQEGDFEICGLTGLQWNASFSHETAEETSEETSSPDDSRPFGELPSPGLEFEVEANVDVEVAPDNAVAIESENGPGLSISAGALSAAPVQLAIGGGVEPLIDLSDFPLVLANQNICFLKEAAPVPIISAEEIDAMFIHVELEAKPDSLTQNIPAQLIEVAEFIRVVEEGVADLIDFAEDVFVELPIAVLENLSASGDDYEDATTFVEEVDLISFSEESSPAHHITQRLLDASTDVKGNLDGEECRWEPDSVEHAGQDDSTGDESPEEDSIEEFFEESKFQETVKVVGVDEILQEKSFEEAQEPMKEAHQTKPQPKYYAPYKPNAFLQYRAAHVAAGLKKTMHERRQREAASIVEEKKHSSPYRYRENDIHKNACLRDANETKTTGRAAGHQYPTEGKDSPKLRRFRSNIHKTRRTIPSDPEEAEKEKEEKEEGEAEEADPIFPGDFFASERKQASPGSPPWFTFNFFSWLSI